MDRSERSRVEQARIVDYWSKELRYGRVSRRSFIRRMTLLGLSTGSIGWLLAACSPQPSASSSAAVSAGASSPPSTSPSASPSAAGPVRGGTLIIGYDTEIPQLEPHTSPGTSSIRFHQLIYTSLLKFSEDLTPVGDLVEDAWDVSDDGLTWTFMLRENVKFSNGDPLTADDVKYTFDRNLNPDIAAIGAGFFSAVESVEARDARTVVFHLKSPSAALPVSLAGYEAVIISKKIAESMDLSTIEAAIGSGPFKVDEWVPDSHMTLSRNEFFYEEGKPYVDGVRVNIIPTQEGLLAAFRAGDLDFTFSDSATFARQADGVSEIAVQRVPALAYNLFFIQTAVKPFDKPQVREALSYALDRQAIEFDSVSLGEGALSGPIPPANERWARPVTDWPDYTRDVAKAKQLLSDAGVPDGFEFTMLTQTSDPAHAPRMAEVAQAQWAEIGVRVKIEPMEFAAWVQHWLDATIQIVPGNNSGQPDPDFYLYRYFHSTGNLQFISGKFHTDELDQLLDLGRKSNEYEERKAAYDSAQEILVNGRPFLWLYTGLLYALTSRRVQGYKHLANEALSYIRDISLTS